MRNNKQFRFSLLIALLIAVLLWRTQWILLRPGLEILLVGQVAIALAYLYRSRQDRAPAAYTELAVISWFDGEERFVRLAAWAESLVRILGFVVLAYGFWNSTRILWITLLLGVAYPVISYFGMAKRNTKQVLQKLHQQSLELS